MRLRTQLLLFGAGLPVTLLVLTTLVSGVVFSHDSNSLAEVTVYEGITALVYVFQCLRYSHLQMLANWP